MSNQKLYSVIFTSAEEREEFVIKNFNKLSLREMARRLEICSTRTSDIARKNNLYSEEYIKGIRKTEIQKVMNEYSGKVTKIELMKILKDKLDLDFSYASVKLWGRRFDFKTLNQKGKSAETRFFIDGNRENLELDNILIVPREIGENILGMNLTGDALIAMIQAIKLKKIAYDSFELWTATKIETGATVEAKTLKELSEICGFCKTNFNKNKKEDDGSTITNGWKVSKRFL